MKKLTIFKKHQLKVAKDTLKLSDAGVFILGGMTKKEAKEIIKKLTGKNIKE